MTHRANLIRAIPVLVAFFLNLAMPAVNVAIPALPSAMDVTDTALAAGDLGHVTSGLNIDETVGRSPINPGEDTSFTVTLWNAGPGTAYDVTVHDELPPGVDWSKPSVVGGSGDECGMASSLAYGGTSQWSFDCQLGDLPAGDKTDGVQVIVTGTTHRDDCGTLINRAWAVPSNGDMVGPAEASVDVQCAVPVVHADEGAVSITVTAQSLQRSLSTPAPSVPDTALVHGLNGQPLSIPVELMVFAFLASLGALAYANVRAVRRRR